MHASRGLSSIAAWLAIGLMVVGLLPTSVLAQRGLPHLIEPPEGSVQFGRSVASGGDANGDGVDDLFISDPGFEVEGVRVGRWFVYDGATREEMWRAVGDAPLGIDELRWSHLIAAAFIGDIDGDGGDDLIVGIPTTFQQHGTAIVYSGRTGDVLHRYDGGEHHYLGIDVSGVGDLNRDGTPDFAFAGRYYAADGHVSFRSGRDGSELHRIEIPYPRRIRGIGDIDGDGHDDAAVSSWRQYIENARVFILSGRTGETTILSAPGGSREDRFAYTMAGSADVTGDGVPDLAVRGGRENSDGVIYIYSGATLEIVSTITDLTERFGLRATRIEFVDVNGDGLFEVFADWGGRVSIYEPLSGRMIRHHPTSLIQNSQGVIYGSESAAGHFNGDVFADVANLVYTSSAEMRRVGLFAGAPLLLSTSETSSGSRLRRGQKYVFIVHGAQSGRRVYFLASPTGHGCTFIPRLGVCIDLDPRIHRLGDALTNSEGFAQLSLEIGTNVPLGPAWLQAIDPADPSRGAITSNVLQVEIVQ